MLVLVRARTSFSCASAFEESLSAEARISMDPEMPQALLICTCKSIPFNRLSDHLFSRGLFNALFLEGNTSPLEAKLRPPAVRENLFWEAEFCF